MGYESWLERDHLTWLDWDRAVIGIASQPFRLSWTGDEGQVRWHVPDFFARRADGSAVVIDCPQPGTRRRAIDPSQLAAITGRPAGHLAWALPELRRPGPDWQAWRHQPQPGCPSCAAPDRTGRPGGTSRSRAARAARRPGPDWQAWRHQPQPGCPSCAARHDGGPVIRLLPHHRYVCTRHRYWTAPAGRRAARPQLGPDLAASSRRNGATCGCSAATAPRPPTTPRC